MDYSDRRPAAAAALLLALGWAALAAAIFVSPNAHLFDEPFYQRYGQLFERFGLSAYAVEKLPGSPGPLVGVLFWLVSPITEFSAHGHRWLNFALLSLALILLWRIGRRLHSPAPIYFAGGLLALPMVWQMAGLGISDMSAVCLLTASVLAFTYAVPDEPGTQGFHGGYLLLSGLLLGLSSLGRQTVLASIIVPATVALWAGRRVGWRDAGFFVALAVIAPCLWIWKALTPPSPLHVNAGISLTNLFTSWGYAGAILFLAAPGFLAMPLRWFGAGAAASTVLSLTLPIVTVTPFQTAAKRLLPGWALPVYNQVTEIVLVTAGVIAVAALLRRMWLSRQDVAVCAGCLGALAIASTPIVVVSNFSSRYTALAAPFLLLATIRFSGISWMGLALRAAGAAGGWISLQSYYSQKPWVLGWQDVLR